jgi:integrase
VSDKGRTQGQSLSIRGVQKRIEGYARCAGVRLVVVQELLGHSAVTSTQRYARWANRRLREEYFAGMRKIIGSTV